MPKQVHSTDKAPGAIGPYSQAVIASGTFAFLSGQIPLTPSGDLVTGSIETQTEQVMTNIGGMLESLDASFADVVKTTIFLSSMDHFGAVNEVYGKHVGGQPPARSTVAVAGLGFNAPNTRFVVLDFLPMTKVPKMVENAAKKCTSAKHPDQNDKNYCNFFGWFFLFNNRAFNFFFGGLTKTS